MPADDYIVIDDFRPGIFSDFHARGDGKGTILANNGAATVENTYRCCADLSGALIPLPALVPGKQSAPKPVGANASFNYPTNMRISFTLDAMVQTEVSEFSNDVRTDPDRAAVYTMHGQWHTTPGSSTLYSWLAIATLHRIHQGALNQQDIMFARAEHDFTAGAGSRLEIGGGSFVRFMAATSDSLSGSDKTNSFVVPVVVMVAYPSPLHVQSFGRSGPKWRRGVMPTADMLLTDFDNANGGNYPSLPTDDNHRTRLVGTYPDYWNVQTPNSYFLSTNQYRGALMGILHQGRLVVSGREFRFNGRNLSGDDNKAAFERMSYSPPLDFDGTLGYGEINYGLWGEDRPFFTGTMASISASELLIVKDAHGGLMIRGDLDNPTVVSLPFIHPTKGARHFPASSPWGLYYGSRDGIHIWEGGEISKHVSNQLDGFFWNAQGDYEFIGSRARFTYWEPYVAISNNYLLDTRNNSWWRLDEITSTKAACSHFDVTPTTNTLYAFPWKLDAQAQTLWYTARKEVRASSYSWQSQPLIETRERTMSFHNIRIMAANAGSTAATVAVTLTGYREDGTALTPVTTTFTIPGNTNRAVMMQRDIETNFVASYVQARVVCNSNNSAIPAPKVHSLALGYADRARNRKAN